ncbi:biosynthetic peptidoglycan transglycosylase, partial [Streptococcus gordonii]|uniref:biosynthetic peptidoglycan transglycosylase n=1 Tax=Streptococcus gordonii TaxID=1302 RepID=UPI001D062662
ALYQNVVAREIRGGGSTITQRLAKNMYYTYQPSYLRKVSEIFTAYDLEKELSKKEILELYVNVINYGDNHIGIREASEGYFHKKPKDLTL